MHVRVGDLVLPQLYTILEKVLFSKKQPFIESFFKNIANNGNFQFSSLMKKFAHLIFVIFGTPPHYLGSCKKYTKKWAS